jgi:hypothetical protein
MSKLLPLIAALGLTLATTAYGATATAPAGARIFKPVTIGTVTNLSSGFVRTTGNVATGTVNMPATFPLQPNPQPSYTGGWAKNGNNADPGTASRVDLSGEPGAQFNISVSSWTHISGDASTMSATTFYSPSGTPTSAAKGVFNAAGNATVYIGGTLTIPRDPNGTTVLKRPVVVVTYP